MSSMSMPQLIARGNGVAVMEEAVLVERKEGTGEAGLRTVKGIEST